MKRLFLFIFFTTLFNNYIVGQSHHGNTLSDNENSVINDLFSYMKDTWYISMDFVVSPIIRSINKDRYINHPSITKYGFRKQTGKENNDTLMIGYNDSCFPHFFKTTL